MSRIIATTEILAPPERVWALLADPSLYPEIAEPTERMIEVPEGSFGEGSVYREYGGIPPFKSESEWTVTLFDPPRRQVHEGQDGQMKFYLDNLLEPTDAGTRFTQELVMTPVWYLAPLNAVLWPLMMRKRAQQAMDGTGVNLKRMAESG